MTELVTVSPLEDRITYAKALAASDLLPGHYKGKPANVLIALELGNALGIAPTTALYGINVINGKPTLGAETMRAVVLAHGHRFDVLAFSEDEAVVRVARKERPSDTSDFSFTMDDARRAGLTGGNYSKYPKAMLLARATSAACRAVFPDVLAGVSYTPDELEPVVYETARPRTVDLEPVVEAEPVEVEVVEAEVVEPAPVEPTVDEVYLKTLSVRAVNLMKAAGQTTKAHRIRYVSDVLHIEPGDVNPATITADEWETVIAALMADALAEKPVDPEPEPDVDEQALTFEEGR